MLLGYLPNGSVVGVTVAFGCVEGVVSIGTMVSVSVIPDGHSKGKYKCDCGYHSNI